MTLNNKDIHKDLEALTIRVYNAYMLLLVYFKIGEFEKILKFLESTEKDH